MNLQQYKNEPLSPEELEEYTQKLVRAKLDEDYRNKWKQKLERQKGIQRNSTKAPIENKRINLFSYWKIAAAIVLILIVAIPSIVISNRGIQYQVDILLAADDFVNMEGGKKGTILDTEASIEEASLAFNKGNYKQANAIYLQLIEKDKTQEKNYFHSGMCFLKLKAFEQSAKQFKEVQKSSADTSYLQDTRWYLSLVLIKLEKKEEAKVLLASIRKGDSHYSEAQKLLKYF